MISSTHAPKNKSELIRSINQLPSNIKFDVIEVFSKNDKATVNKLFDQYASKGQCSVVFIKIE
jgi:hypothetical protein